MNTSFDDLRRLVSLCPVSLEKWRVEFNLLLHETMIVLHVLTFSGGSHALFQLPYSCVL